MGAVMIPMMKREGYAADYAVNVTTHAALVGALMPTSHNMIIYSLAAGGKVSIAALILAGVIPALILTLCNLAAAYLVAVKRGYPAGKFPGWDMVLWSFIASVPGLFVVVIIITGILSGVFTATESASVAVIYALLMTTLVYRSLSWENFLKAAAKAVKTTGTILLLIGISATFGYLISLYSVAELTGKALADDLDQSVDDLLPRQPDPVHPRHVPRHGGDDPDLHADLPADLPEVRDGPRAVRDGHADQLRARAQHAARRHDAVRRLRDRRRVDRLRDAHDLAVLRRAHRRADARHLRAGVLDVAAACSSATSNGTSGRFDRGGGRR